jgi:hypothetical protein
LRVFLFLSGSLKSGLSKDNKKDFCKIEAHRDISLLLLSLIAKSYYIYITFSCELQPMSYELQVMPYALCAMSHELQVIRHALCALRPAPCALRSAPCAMRSAPCAMSYELFYPFQTRTTDTVTFSGE